MRNWFKKNRSKEENLKNDIAENEPLEKETSASESSPEEGFSPAGEVLQEETPSSGSDGGGKSAETLQEGTSSPDSENNGISTNEDTNTPNKKKPWSLKKKIIISVTSVLAAVILGCALFIGSLFIDPMGRFKTVAQQAPITPGPSVSQTVNGNVDTTPTPTLNPYDELMAKSDPTILEQTVNILLIGVDYAPERDDWTGKHYFHSDVMIVLAINKQTGSVNLISLPRDTYAEIPGVKGIYKLNASMDCGGGWKDNPEAACKKVCEAASWMIGGIPIDYYYAVDMSAVKGLVDSIGGVDFNIEVAFKMQGRPYQIGMQHMDGQAVLDFLRARKDMDDSGDLNRINRQKDMLIAILKKLKDSGLVFKIPDIIGAFNGNLQTNVSLESTGALAAFASTIDTNNIKLYSMDGPYCYHIFNWNFVLTDQNKRVQIIKDVYGFDITNDVDVQALESKYGIKVPSYSDYSMRHALGLWEKMQRQVTRHRARPLLDQIKSKLDADALLPPYPKPAAPDPTVSADPSLPSPTPVPSEGYRKYSEGGEIWALYNKTESEYSKIMDWGTSGATKSSDKQFQEALTLLQEDVKLLCSKFGINKKWEHYWEVDYGDHAGKPSSNQSYVENEIPVDFN